MPSPPRVHHKRFGVLRNRAVRDEIASLDAQRDCQRIVHLLACHEFGFDITRSLELALFHTYGSRSVSRLLDATGEFRRRGQKRYDDTRLLIAHFLESGYDSDFGRRAIARMNEIHGRFRIPNDDFLFVLSTFVSYPADWLARYGHRPMTAHEHEAWWCFFREVGHRMGLRDVPEQWPQLQAFVARYEAEQLVWAPSNRAVADATVAVFAGWFPRPLRFAVEPSVRALIAPRLRAAFGYPPAPRAWAAVLHAVLRLRARLKRVIHLEAQPRLVATTRNRSYPGNDYCIEEIGPPPRKEAA
ncbi:MAG TPA: oxygenase MpaB family protein [Albitalea sp.]|nr:oxygenase MpaB family protein [Albitalea sp.]